MATVAKRLMTAEEFYEWSQRPENRDKMYELERGEVVEVSRAGKLHCLICMNVGAILWLFVRQRPKGYVCCNDVGTIIQRNPDTVRGPDVAVFEDTEQYEEVDLKYGESPPVLAVEVLSPNDTTGTVNRRILEQLKAGTKLVWLIDPFAKNVTVYRQGREPYIVEDKQELTGDDVLPDFKCRVGEFFTLSGR
jgi:Uma2 family endonuclease